MVKWLAGDTIPTPLCSAQILGPKLYVHGEKLATNSFSYGMTYYVNQACYFNYAVLHLYKKNKLFIQHCKSCESFLKVK
jgi:hypothetical protein